MSVKWKCVKFLKYFGDKNANAKQEWQKKKNKDPTQ